jgi:hypothetical protein
LFEAVDKLATAVMALMVLFAVVDVAIFLVLGRLTPWTHVSDNHGLLLTSTVWEAFLANSSTESFHEHYMDSTTRMPAAHRHQIRDAPCGCRRRLSGLLREDTREAA